MVITSYILRENEVWNREEIDDVYNLLSQND
jgi:hypothetical protein